MNTFCKTQPKINRYFIHVCIYIYIYFCVYNIQKNTEITSPVNDAKKA